FFSSRRRHTRFSRDWSSDVCSSDLAVTEDTARGIARQNDEVQQAATAVTEMSTAVDEVAGNATRTSVASSEAEQEARAGLRQVAASRASIDQLSGRLEQAAATVERLASEAESSGQ